MNENKKDQKRLWGRKIEIHTKIYMADIKLI